MPDRLARIVASLDTPGGQMILCLLAMCLGAFFFKVCGIARGEDLIVLFAGAMAGAMRGKGAENHDYSAPQAGSRLPGAGESGEESTTTTTTATPSPIMVDKTTLTKL